MKCDRCGKEIPVGNYFHCGPPILKDTIWCDECLDKLVEDTPSLLNLLPLIVDRVTWIDEADEGK
ncbi:MAG: hypothetical protein QXU63_05655 [Nitrososphaerota archaeon]